VTVSAKPVRVRFAPSPTGYLHVGGARTAIFNWLFARRHRGTFVLRIEDTDVERSTRESETALVDDLHWLGIDWEEGPDVGGPLGPYRQSERIERYRGHARAFVDAGLAYSCFCSDELLRRKREEAEQAGTAPRYDGACRNLSAGDVEARRKQGVAEAIRFKVPDEVVRIDDLVRGQVELASDTVGDFVLIRSNGHPTYNFAAVVDDHAMGITHVLRGEEHLPNTLRQVLVYRALGADAPEFGHLPLILAEDRSKLSKRHAASSVGDLKRLGFLPEAVVNYLVLLGWSHPEGKELLSIDDMVGAFSIERVNRSAAVYDGKKLTWMNGQYIRKAPLDRLVAAAGPFLPPYVRSDYTPPAQREILDLLRDGVETLADLERASLPFRPSPPLDDEAKACVGAENSRRVLAALRVALAKAPDPVTANDFKATMKAIAKETSVGGQDLYFPVRAAITGSVHGPDLARVAAIKGKATVQASIDRALSIGRPA
jgi:nondiscriminating glutamyl-tRNA synthetase